MLGDVIKQLRVKKGLSVSELATKCNVSSSYIYQLERNDKKFPSLEVLSTIAKALNVSVNYLFEEDTNADSNSITNMDTLIKDVQSFFLNPKVSEDDKNKVMREIQNLFWESKEPKGK